MYLGPDFHLCPFPDLDKLEDMCQEWSANGRDNECFRSTIAAGSSFKWLESACERLDSLKMIDTRNFLKVVFKSNDCQCYSAVSWVLSDDT